jgi:hypothetical protein
MKARAPPAKTEAIDSSNGISVDIGIVIPKLMVFSNTVPLRRLRSQRLLSPRSLCKTFEKF